MNEDPTLFETETMADLCARQGRPGEAIAIYRRLSLMAGAPTEAQARWRTRIIELERKWQPAHIGPAAPLDVPLPTAPGVRVLAAEDQVTVAWALPPGTPCPTLELLVLQRTPAGIETVKQSIALETASGRIGLVAGGLHSALAAAGTARDGKFIPLARSR